MTNREIYELYGALIRNQQLKFCKTAYAAFRNLGVVRDQGETIDKMRLALLREYGDEENGNYKLVAENLQAFQTKEKELMDMECELELYKVPRDVFDGDAERLITEDGVSMGDCATLERYLVDDEV